MSRKIPFANSQAEATRMAGDMQVRVYRNLHRGCYSVSQQGRVIFHIAEISLVDCTMVVRQAGRNRCLRERRKNVHAFIAGHVATATRSNAPSTRLRYDPYESDAWRTIDKDGNEKKVCQAEAVFCGADRVCCRLAN
jgi:hypothetical protein